MMQPGQFTPHLPHLPAQLARLSAYLPRGSLTRKGKREREGTRCFTTLQGNCALRTPNVEDKQSTQQNTVVLH